MHNPHQAPQGERDYADRDIPVGKIMLFGFYTAIFTVVTFVAMKLVFRKLEADANRADRAVASFVSTRTLPPQPLLQVDEPRTWQQELAAQRAMVSGYAWVDPQAGVVRIPVERAIELIAERGLPAREAPAAE
jgi:hypothetical protein